MDLDNISRQARYPVTSCLVFWSAIGAGFWIYGKNSARGRAVWRDRTHCHFLDNHFRRVDERGRHWHSGRGLVLVAAMGSNSHQALASARNLQMVAVVSPGQMNYSIERFGQIVRCQCFLLDATVKDAALLQNQDVRKKRN